MSTALIFLLFLLGASCILLFVVTAARKLYSGRREKFNRKNRDAIQSAINGFIAGTEQDYRDGLKEFARNALGRDKNYLAAVDGYLLGLLESHDGPENGAGTENPAPLSPEEYRKRLVNIAAHLYFPAECLAQIRSRNRRISARGSRRAGLYNIKEAVPDMETVLDFFSSENQFEILMALARMGEAEALRRAFDKIKESILVNERGIMEILASFPGGEAKNKLFRSMLHSETYYLTVLFLKAAGGEMTKTLLNDIIQILEDGNKEVRTAALRGLASLDKNAPEKILIHALEDKDWEVRALAAKALGPIRTRESSAALYKALYDQQWWVRQNAANALAGHPNYEALFILAAESGDEYAKDSVIAALENVENPLLLRSLKIVAA